MNSVSFSEHEYQEFSRFLESQCGIVLGDNKQYLVRSRLTPLLPRYGCTHLSELLKQALHGINRDLRTSVVDAMTTNETLWFRDNYPFDILAERLLPEFAVQKRPIRIWSAACSSGQEPYSIAMTVLETQMRRPGMLPMLQPAQIVATDISPQMLEISRQASYDALALGRGLSPERKRQFFEAQPDGRMQLNNKVRNLVSFKPLNLKESYALMGKFDIIFCRNVLIYFSAEMKAKVINQLAACLQPGGYLLLGASESMTGLSDRFEMVRCMPGIIYKLK
ncbi:MAG: CheR family methyltransferase [Plesiomonas sp.]